MNVLNTKYGHLGHFFVKEDCVSSFRVTTHKVDSPMAEPWSDILKKNWQSSYEDSQRKGYVKKIRYQWAKTSVIVDADYELPFSVALALIEAARPNARKKSHIAILDRLTAEINEAEGRGHRDG